MGTFRKRILALGGSLVLMVVVREASGMNDHLGVGATGALLSIPLWVVGPILLVFLVAFVLDPEDR